MRYESCYGVDKYVRSEHYSKIKYCGNCFHAAGGKWENQVPTKDGEVYVLTLYSPSHRRKCSHCKELHQHLLKRR